MKHSPGPWSWGWRDDDGEHREADKLQDAAGRGLSIYFESGFPATTEDDANAALIASAPSMLAMLLELEWGSVPENVLGEWKLGRCAICDGIDLHRPDCRLAALLQPFRGPAA